jgi:hypothetical protein
MKTYALSSQGISKIRQRFLQRMSIFLGVICFVVIGISYWATPNKGITTVIVSVVICVGIMVFALSSVLRQSKEIWESIRIEMTDEYIARTQARIPQVRINRQEITSIEEIDGGICIRTADKSRTLAILNDLDENHYQEIKNKLSTWSTIQPQSPKTKAQNAFLLVVLLLGFGILFLSSSLWLVLVAGVSLISYYAYNYWSLRQVKGVDPRFRRHMSILFLFPLFIMIMKVCLLSGAIDLLTRSR